MKTVICGGSTFRYDYEDFDALDRTRLELPITRVLCPLMPGAAGCGWHWAVRRKIKHTLFDASIGVPADAEAVILFPGEGAYTELILKQVSDRALELYDWRGVSKTKWW